jgi:hypothetical protein
MIEGNAKDASRNLILEVLVLTGPLSACPLADTICFSDVISTVNAALPRHKTPSCACVVEGPVPGG